MRFHYLTMGMGHRYYEGCLRPYPDDLAAVILEPEMPTGMHAEITTGDRPADMLEFLFNVVSGRLIRVLEEVGATGFLACPLRVHLAKKDVWIPDYFLLKVTGRGGPMDWERSVARKEEWGTSYRAVYMDESKWDGSDVFCMPGMGVSTYVTERIAEAIKRAKLTNVRLIPNSECHLP